MVLFWQLPGNHIVNKQGCPKCKSSKGEKFVRQYLTEKNIKFEEQYKINLENSFFKIDFCIKKLGKSYIYRVQWETTLYGNWVSSQNFRIVGTSRLEFKRIL